MSAGAVDVATLRAVLVADTSQYGAGLSKAERRAQGFERKSTKSFGKAGAAAKAMGKTGGVALGVGLAVGVKKSVDAFREQQKVSRQTDAALKSTGRAAGMSKKNIEDLATALSKKTGIDDEAIQSTENLLLTFTKIGKKSGVFKEATGLALDMSTALGVDAKSAAMQLGKALNDPIKGAGALSRSGIDKTAIEHAKALAESGKKLEAQKYLLKEVAKEFGGSAAAVATPVDHLMVTLDSIGEKIGGVVVPWMDKGAGAVNNFLTGLMEGGGAAGGFGAKVASAFGSIKSALGPAFGKDFTNALKTISEEAMPILTNIGKIFKWVFQSVILPVVKRSIPGIIQMFQGFFRAISGVVKLISGLLSGDFKKMWSGIKLIFSGAIKALGGLIRHSTAVIRAAAVALARGFVAGLKAAPGAALGAGKWLINKAVAGVKSLGARLLNVGKWITDQIKKGLGKIVPNIGKPKIPDLNPFGGAGGGNVGPLGNDSGGLGAAGSLAAKFGNGITSGYRPGDPGWHGKNRARDYAGGNMLGFAKAAASKFGGRLLELIHTPLGFGIKNGKKVPLSYWGAAVNADHHDHVHVAMRRGGKAGPNQGGPSVVYGEGKKTEWWVSQEGNRQKNIGYAMEALQSLTGNRLSMFKDGGKKMGASVFGGPNDPGTGHIGYRGDDLRKKWNSFAELNMGTAMGGLSYGAGRWVTGPNGKSLKLYKRDIGRGGGNVNGRVRGIDLWYKAAQKLGVNGLGTVTVSKSKPSGAKPKPKGKNSFKQGLWGPVQKGASPGDGRGGFEGGSMVGGGWGGSTPISGAGGGFGASVGVGGMVPAPEPGEGATGEDPAVILAQIRDELRKISANSDATRNIVRGEIEQSVLDFFNKGIGGRLAGGSRLASAGVSY